MSDPSEIIDAYLDGVLSNEQIDAMEKWINTSDANTAAFVRRCFDHQQLRTCFLGEETRDLLRMVQQSSGESGAFFAQLLEMETAAGKGEIVDLTESIERQKQLAQAKEAQPNLQLTGSVHNGPRVIVVSKWLIYGGAIAAVVAIVAAISILRGPGTPTSPPGIAQQTEPPQHAAPSPPRAKPVHARLIASHDAVWASGAPTDDLHAGDVLELVQGRAELVFTSQANVSILGGTRLEVVGLNTCRITTGTLAGRVPPSAKGFEVEVPGGLVRDLGTEFTVQVQDNGTSRVAVQKGEVSIGVTTLDGARSSQLFLTPGIEGEIDSTGKVARIFYESKLDLISTGQRRGVGERDGNWLISGVSTDANYSMTPSLVSSSHVHGDALVAAWEANTEKSSWIIEPGQGTQVPEGQVTTYRYSFAIPRHARLDLLKIVSRVWADDFLDAILVNGNPLYTRDDDVLAGVTYSHTTEVVLDRFFVEGENTLEFLIRNNTGEPVGHHPSGIRVEFDPASVQILREVRIGER